MHKIRRSIANAACHPKVGTLLATIFADRIPAGNIIVDTSHPLIVPSTKAQLFWGLYERAESRFIRRYLRRDRDVIELGASLGIVSCLIRSLLPPNQRLVCVEAHPDLINLLKENLSRNSLQDNVTIRQEAIDYDPTGREEVSLAVGDDTTGAHIGAGSIRAKTATLSKIIDETSLQRFSMVSDIEGAEAGLLLNEIGALRNCDQVIIELHKTTYGDRRLTVDDLKQILIETHGFKLRDQHGPVCVFDRVSGN